METAPEASALLIKARSSLVGVNTKPETSLGHSVTDPQALGEEDSGLFTARDQVRGKGELLTVPHGHPCPVDSSVASHILPVFPVTREAPPPGPWVSSLLLLVVTFQNVHPDSRGSHSAAPASVYKLHSYRCPDHRSTGFHCTSLWSTAGPYRNSRSYICCPGHVACLCGLSDLLPAWPLFR